MKYTKILMFLLSGTLFMVSCSKSPEEKLNELVPRFQKAICSKTIECTKDELEKIPAQYRNMIPPFMQSEENCVSHFKEEFEKAKQRRTEKKEQVTPEMVSTFEACISGLEASTCEPFKSSRGKKLNIPGCEDLEKLTKPE
ncbi:hypothetical protein EHQ53_09985 [Leptospira langatensis]|uniref:Lipoprotein n=1 Tax=Leptospira langatensis TaxID=2484983 RepID=A0A5F1ZUK7_9LEPT|nr:hypothetical protein [Leptospira langatensis]TGK00237.1 hypothetical protein EHO57_13205 [Leptospira langatensis]TGL41129.1 hypothetical protein EHQ53_09985 [Leptospira langatensis]